MGRRESFRTGFEIWTWIFGCNKGSAECKISEKRKETMKYSICIPVYNVEKYLAQCLDSIMNQEFTDYEVILIDDGSTDKSAEICDEYQEKYSNIIRVVHKQNEGLLAARIEAYQLVKGDYCLCVDSDDYLETNYLSTIDEMISKYDPDFVLFDLYYNDGNHSWSINKESNGLLPRILYRDLVFLKTTLLEISFNSWSMCAKCMKREFIHNFYELKKYSIAYGEDTLQTIILYNHAKTFVYINDKLYNYRTKSGMTYKQPSKRVYDFRSIVDMMNELCRDWTENIDYTRKVYFTKILAEHFMNIIQTSDTLKETKERARLVFSNEIRDYLIFDQPSIGFKKKVVLKMALTGKIGLLRTIYRIKHLRKEKSNGQ